MSSKRILFFAVMSILVLIAVGRYGVQDAPLSDENQEATGDLNRLSGEPPAPQPDAVSPVEGVQPSAPVAAALTAEDQNKLALLRDVIKSGKDNDPRVDKELKNLSPALKTALKKEYQQLPKEHLNGRGFIAFLIGRSLSEPGDVEFLEQVVKEEPCLSFKDCDAKGPMYEEAQEHSTEVSLNYPQIVATRMLKQNLSKAPPALRSKISEAVASSRF